MKKLTYILGALALVSFLFASCKKENKTNLDNVIEDGFYVAGSATGASALKSEYMMTAGVNEVDKVKRTGMFEKYVVLDANKDFELLYYEAGKRVRYSAVLADFTPDFTKEIYADNPDMKIFKGKLITGDKAPAMKVTKKGLYHIVLDLNKANDLAGGPQIILAPVEWGVRGAMNSWGYTAMTKKEAGGVVTYTVKDCDMPANGEFKFSYGGWKITLDDAGKVKAETNLGKAKDGKGLAAGGDNIKVEKAGLYDITLTFKLSSGALGASYSYETKLTKESTLATEMYMIGEEFGSWDWGNAGVVTMIPFHSQPGMFWAVRYISAAKGFKFCPVKDWKGDFNQLTTNVGEGVNFNDGGNVTVATSGIYCIGVDVKNSKLVVEKAHVYGIGDAFGSWDAKTHAYTESGKVMKIKATANGNMRSYVASSLLSADGDWWHAEFVVNKGKIEYRGTGDDPVNVSVTAGKTITLDFNAGTGSIK